MSEVFPVDPVGLRYCGSRINTTFYISNTMYLGYVKHLITVMHFLKVPTEFLLMFHAHLSDKILHLQPLQKKSETELSEPMLLDLPAPGRQLILNPSAKKINKNLVKTDHKIT